MKAVEIHKGSGPVVLGMPHTGLYVPDEVKEALNANGRQLADTDWHIDRLYDGLLGNATIVRATFNRYVIDANRDPEGISLYPGQNTTTLVPLTDFDGGDIWKKPPGGEEIEQRRKLFHAVYHEALANEIERVRRENGIAILYDCHSIRSNIPFLFEGKLPDFNIGTNLGATCDPKLEQSVSEICSAAHGYTTVVNGRFKGGWTTRYYGRPEEGVHAIQMELAQSTYLKTETAPFEYDLQKAEKMRMVLQQILETLESFARSAS